MCLLMPKPCKTSIVADFAHESGGGCSRTSGEVFPIGKLDVSCLADLAKSVSKSSKEMQSKDNERLRSL